MFYLSTLFSKLFYLDKVLSWVMTLDNSIVITQTLCSSFLISNWLTKLSSSEELVNLLKWIVKIVSTQDEIGMKWTLTKYIYSQMQTGLKSKGRGPWCFSKSPGRLISITSKMSKLEKVEMFNFFVFASFPFPVTKKQIYFISFLYLLNLRDLDKKDYYFLFVYNCKLTRAILNLNQYYRYAIKL